MADYVHRVVRLQRLRAVTFFDIAVAALQAKAIEFDFEENNSFFDVVQAAMEKDDQEEQEQDKEERKAIADQMKELEVLTKRQDPLVDLPAHEEVLVLEDKSVAHESREEKHVQHKDRRETEMVAATAVPTAVFLHSDPQQAWYQLKSDNILDQQFQPPEAEVQVEAEEVRLALASTSAATAAAAAEKAATPEAVLPSHHSAKQEQQQQQHATELTVTDKRNQPISEVSRPFANLSSCERGENDHYEEHVVAASSSAVIPHEQSSIAPVMIREESVAFFASMSSCERGENENNEFVNELNQNVDQHIETIENNNDTDIINIAALNTIEREKTETEIQTERLQNEDMHNVELAKTHDARNNNLEVRSKSDFGEVLNVLGLNENDDNITSISDQIQNMATINQTAVDAKKMVEQKITEESHAIAKEIVVESKSEIKMEKISLHSVSKEQETKDKEEREKKKNPFRPGMWTSRSLQDECRVFGSEDRPNDGRPSSPMSVHHCGVVQDYQQTESDDVCASVDKEAQDDSRFLNLFLRKHNSEMYRRSSDAKYMENRFGRVLDGVAELRSYVMTDVIVLILTIFC